MSVYLSEFLGTMVMILLGDGVVAGVLLQDSKAKDGGWLVITLAWGMAVLMGIYVASASGAHMNPALTVALAAIGKFDWSLVPGYALAQMLGAFCGAVLVYLHYLPHWRGTADADAKRAVFCTSPALRSLPANFLSEVIGTFMLVFGVLAIGTNAMVSGFGPLAVALLVAVIGLSLGGTTGYAINPARDLAPRIAHALLPIPGKRDSDWGYALIPVLGPLTGGLLGAFIFRAAFG